MDDNEDLSAEFAGKILLVMLITSCEEHAIIYDARVQCRAGRKFLVGTVPPSVLPGFAGVQVGLAWDQVQQYYVLDDAEHYERARRTYLEDAEYVPRTFFQYFAKRICSKKL